MQHFAMTNMSCDMLVTSLAQGVGTVPDGCINLSLWEETEIRLKSYREHPSETAIQRCTCLVLRLCLGSAQKKNVIIYMPFCDIKLPADCNFGVVWIVLLQM